MENQKHNLDEKAVKADDAAVPIEFWNSALASKLGLEDGLSKLQSEAIDIIRNFAVHCIWKRSVTRCLCRYLVCSNCHNKRMTLLFQHDNTQSDPQCNECRSYRARSKALLPVESDREKVYEWRCTNGKKRKTTTYRWKSHGKRLYNKWFHLFRKSSRPKEAKRVAQDIKAGIDCLSRVSACTTWKWEKGSRLFFWRWGEEFSSEARDGSKTFIQSKLPNCQERQKPPRRKDTLNLVRDKLNDVRRKGYISDENLVVKSVTSLFDVPKGDNDVRMVYNATSSGLNDAVWAPWFSLPTVESHLRAVDPGTFMVDCDLGEMFLNFMLDVNIRPYAGVDLTEIFPEENEGDGKLLEHWCRMLMGYRYSPYSTTRDVKRQEPFLKGDRKDKSNIFRWERVIINLPGDNNYDPTKPRVYKVREDGTTVAADLFIYIENLRNTGPTEVEGWEGAHQVCCRLTWLGIQDAPRKKNFSSKTPRAWAGTIIHSDKGAVTLLVSEEKWLKTKEWVRWILDNVDNNEGISHKTLLSCRGFLIYVSRTYTPFKPYLRGLHKTIDGWRPFRDEEGWKLTYAILEAKDNGMWEELMKAEPDEFVTPMARLKPDFEALKALTDFDAPPKVVRRRSKVGTVFYGFGDASGKGFGFCLEINGVNHSEYGKWNAVIEAKHSNYKELRNLVTAVEKAHQLGQLDNCELYLFTDNYVAECAYYNGGSNRNKDLDKLVFRLWQLQMQGNFTLFFYHVAGTRMIASGVDGLSRGDKTEGVAKGLSVLDFVPIHLNPLERSRNLKDWVHSWWDEAVCGELTWLSPEGWFDKVITPGNYVWNVAPGAGEAAVDQLCSHTHGRPESTHLFLIPRLCTGHWRKQLGKVCDVLLTIDPIHDFWSSDMHEPLIIGIYSPLLPPLYKYRPWRFKFTKHVELLERKVRCMQAARQQMDWNCLREFLSQTRTICSMPDDVAREMLQTKGRG